MIKTIVAGSCAATLVLACVAPSALARRSATTTPNLIANGGAEAAAGSTDGSTVPVPSWTLTTGTTFTAVQYGAGGGFPTASDPGPVKRGANFFAGGSGEPLEVATQVRSVPTAFRAAVDAGTATFALQGYFGGFSTQEDSALLSIEWRAGNNSSLGGASVGPVSATQRTGLTGLKLRKNSGAVPVGTRKVVLTLTLARTDGSYNDGYADALSLRISQP